ncbi:hypothetical protein ACIBHX_21300 [Nonomuraea sp. NPDC050536]|uniref:hypothetical protein n=1 Tax=Nonomuraea sp. NPDC050536 TaxID=3364366 RepID=UPI0037C94A53
MTVIEEGAKKSSILWLTLDRPRLAWHAWHEGAIYLVSGPGEQQLPGLADLDTVHVTLRSKDNGARLVEFDAGVEQTTDPEAIAVLAKARLNAPEGLIERWAGEATVFKLTVPDPE